MEVWINWVNIGILPPKNEVCSKPFGPSITPQTSCLFRSVRKKPVEKKYSYRTSSALFFTFPLFVPFFVPFLLALLRLAAPKQTSQILKKKILKQQIKSDFFSKKQTPSNMEYRRFPSFCDTPWYHPK